MTKNVVIVESPAKAKTINKYLGKDYHVIASFGHIRDLPSKNGSVDPAQDFAMIWEKDARGKKHLLEISKLVKDADCVYLATDPDREGEAIAWHVMDALCEKKAFQKIPFKRVTFNEITKKAVTHAIANPRKLHQDLIDAYLARRALDYLVGFNLSPLLWRKLPGSKSAGRVQSIALKLICEREFEIEDFRTDEYWSIHADFLTIKQDSFAAKLRQYQSKKLEKLSIKNEAEAKAIQQDLESQKFTIDSIEKKRVKRNPAPPFITSTIQQEASRKLGFSASRTMSVAQKLYEGINLGGETIGLISYMRTDGVQLSDDAISSLRKAITSKYGKDYLPDSKRVYKSKVKNAQEGHEAIRPTDAMRAPSDIKSFLSDDEYKLYNLVWCRAMACQMKQAELDQVAISIFNPDKTAEFRANGSIVAFDGFFKVYTEGRDDSKAKDTDEVRLPIMQEGEALSTEAIKTDQHFTQPPPRYTEASLVKKMEELGIGRPSTYASVMQVLQTRNYVILDQKRFFPESRGRIVTEFLNHFFDRVMAYSFTSDLEEKLDDISAGTLDWKVVLKEFWERFSGKIEEASKLRISEVLDYLDEKLSAHFFPPREDGSDPKKCRKCDTGTLHLKVGKFGAFIGCTNYPDCGYTKPLNVDDETAEAEAENSDKELGADPETNEVIALKKGPYGFYVQRGVADKEKKTKPKRTSLPKGFSPGDIDLSIALELLSLPKQLGEHPDTKEKISVSIGRYGPYVQYGRQFKSIPAADNLLTLTLDRAIEIINTASDVKKSAPAKEVAKYPKDDTTPITYAVGRYGPYIKYKKTIVSIPKGKTIEELSTEEIIELIDKKRKK